MKAIEFVNVGKQYRLGRVGTGTLQHDLNRWWQTTIMGKEDPYLKIGDVNDRATKGNSDYVWALKDINFSVEQGDVVGIIGKNGAGKSTLLKLLSHITSPSTGTIRYEGRIASLLEVGTGFHPELTARENIYMNGSIMGMTKHEIDRKLDEIVDFAGVERYLDTPVKRFSSGMTVRLGFAVAAFLEPEILVVDEVLAVGDAEFQKKAIGKMGEISSQGGRTVLFVSHNMASVRRLCNRGVVLKNGMVHFIGNVNDAISEYVNEYLEKSADMDIADMPREGKCSLKAKIVNVEFMNENNLPINPHCGQFLRIRFTLDVISNGCKKCRLDWGFNDAIGGYLTTFSTSMQFESLDLKGGLHFISCDIPKLPVVQGKYRISIHLDADGECSDWLDKTIAVNIEEDQFFRKGWTLPNHLLGHVVLCEHNWVIE